MYRPQLNLQRLWRTALWIFAGLIALIVVLQLISIVLPRAAGLAHTVLLLVKFITAVAMLIAWGLLNIPPPKPVQGRMVIGAASFAEVEASRYAGSKMLGEVHPPRRTWLHLIRPRLKWEATVNEEGRTIVPLPLDGYDMGDFIAQRLARQFSAIRDLVVTELPFVSSVEEATALGRERNADLVIWGAVSRRTPDQQYVRFWARCSLTKAREPHLPDTEFLLVAPRSFPLGPKRISVNHERYVGITPFVSFIAGLAYYTFGDPEGAADEFGAALIGDMIAAGREPDEEEHIDAQALTLLFLGNAQLLTGEIARAERSYRDAIKLNKHFGDAICNLGLLHIHRGDMVAALDLLTEAVHATPEQPLIHYNFGLLQQQLGRADQALRSFKQAVGIDPSFAEAQRSLALMLHAQGETDEAFVALRQALAHKPDMAAAYRDLATLYIEREMYDKAQEELERALASDPNHATSYYQLGLLRQRQGRNDEAIDALQEAISLRPDFGQAHYALGVLYRNEGRLDLALNQFSEARGFIDSADTHINLGMAYEQQGRHDEAEEEFRRALKLEPDNAQAHLMLGRLLRARGNYDEALTELRAALKTAPDLPAAYLELAELRRDQGDLPRAIQTVEQLVGRNGQRDAEAWHTLGKLYVAHARSDNGSNNTPLIQRAIDAFGKAAQINPQDSRALYNMASAYLLGGDRFTAIEKLRQALQIQPQDGDAWELLGVVQRDLRQLNEAIESLQRASRLRPKEISPYTQLATTYRALGQLDKSITALREALKLQPTNAKLHAQLADLYTTTHRFDHAVQSLTRATQLEPDNAELFTSLGEAHRSAGRPDEAINALSTAVKLSPGNLKALLALSQALRAKGDLQRASEVLLETMQKHGPSAQLYFALGEIYTAMGQGDRATEAYRMYAELRSTAQAQRA